MKEAWELYHVRGRSRNVEGGVHIVCKAVGGKFVVAQALVIFKWYGTKLAAVAFIVLLLFVLGDTGW